MKRMMLALLLCMLLFSSVTAAFATPAIPGEKEMYLLSKSDAKLDSDGHSYVDLIFCFLDDSQGAAKLRTFDRNFPKASAKAGDELFAEIIFGRNAYEAKTLFDEQLGCWVVRLTTVKPEELAYLSTFEMQVTATRVVQKSGGFSRQKYRFSELAMEQLRSGGGITSGEILNALTTSRGVVDHPASTNVSKSALKAAKDRDIQFVFEGYAVGFEKCQLEEDLNLFAVKKQIEPIASRYEDGAILSYLMFWDTQKLPSKAKVTVELDEFSPSSQTSAYVYLYKNNRPVLLTDKAAYTDERDSVIFETDQLGVFIVASKPLKELPVLSGWDLPTSPEGADVGSIASMALETIAKVFSLYTTFKFL